MSNKPLVSIGLPTYNRAPSLRRAIESVLVQDYQNIVLIVSDNASTDETQAVCLEAARYDGRVKYFRRQTNQGATANFREVLAHSDGEFFMWLADDDWLDPTYVGRCVQVLLEHPNYSLVCGKARYFQEEEFVHDGLACDLLQDRGSDRVLAYYAHVADNGTFYGVMRRTQILRAPMRNTLGGDWLLVAATAFMGKIKTLGDTCVNRNLGGATVSFERIAATLGLSSFAVTHPNLSVAAAAFSDIVWHSSAYSEIGILSRLRLGCRVFALVADRGATLFGRNAYSKYAPRRIAFTVMTRVLPANMLDRIRTWRRQKRAARVGH